MLRISGVGMASTWGQNLCEPDFSRCGNGHAAAAGSYTSADADRRISVITDDPEQRALLMEDMTRLLGMPENWSATDDKRRLQLSGGLKVHGVRDVRRSLLQIRFLPSQERQQVRFLAEQLPEHL